MRVMDPGHFYDLDSIDDGVAEVPLNRNMLRFVKRIGDKFPGNTGPSTSGTITQEVIRALIDRTEYVDGQRRHVRNGLVLYHLREALRELEMRAAEEREATPAETYRIQASGKPELLATCSKCGHVECNRSHAR